MKDHKKDMNPRDQVDQVDSWIVKGLRIGTYLFFLLAVILGVWPWSKQGGWPGPPSASSSVRSSFWRCSYWSFSS